MKKGIGQEDKMHINFGQMLAQYKFYNQLHCDFATYCPYGEQRNIATGAMLKKKFTRKGVPDYMLIKDGEVIWLEFKTRTGKQSSSQEEFEEMCKKSNNMYYYIVRSIEEAINVLRDHLIIT